MYTLISHLPTYCTSLLSLENVSGWIQIYCSCCISWRNVFVAFFPWFWTKSPPATNLIYFLPYFGFKNLDVNAEPLNVLCFRALPRFLRIFVWFLSTIVMLKSSPLILPVLLLQPWAKLRFDLEVISHILWF